MVALRAKLAVGSLAGLAVAGLLGAGLANYAESGAFSFYKQPRMTAWAPIEVADSSPPPDTAYPGSYGLYTVAPRSHIDAIYPERDIVVFDPDPVEPAIEPVTEIVQPEPASEAPREPFQPVAPSEVQEASSGEAWVTAKDDAPPPEEAAEPVSAIY